MNPPIFHDITPVKTDEIPFGTKKLPTITKIINIPNKKRKDFNRAREPKEKLGEKLEKKNR